MGSKITGSGPAKLWPKVHLIYFLLAAFDLIAVGGGLILSYRLSEHFTHGNRETLEWSTRFKSVWDVSDHLAKVIAPASEIFGTNDIQGQVQALSLAAVDFKIGISSIRREVGESLNSERKQAAMALLGEADVLMRKCIETETNILKLYAAGDLAGAAVGMKDALATVAQLRKALKSVAELVHQQGEAAVSARYAQVQELKRFEYLIGAGILFMVCCVVFYGHYIGKLMGRKYQELQAAHSDLHQSQVETMQFATQLQAVNDDVTKLNRDLADNLTKLREAQDEIVRKSKMAQIGQLTATVAHELRNPLGAVRTSVFLLGRKLNAKELGVEPQIERIQNGVVRCDNIITQLLDFSRSKALQYETGKIDEWLKKTLDEEIPKLPKAVRVECVFGLGDLQAPMDAERMSRVIINLVSNASEAMVGKGDDPSKFATQRPCITIESRLASRGIEIAVTDNGPGITAENLKKILEPLFTTKSFGTGLGLPAVEKILEQHGGGLEVKSAPGEGARFTAWVPLSKAGQEAA